MFSKKFFAFIMSVFLLSICSTTNAYGPATFHSDPEVLMNLIKLSLEKKDGPPITISNARYYTKEGAKHFVANFDNNAKNEIDFSLKSDGSVFIISITEDFSDKRKFSEETKENLVMSILSSASIVFTICDVFEFKLPPKDLGSMMSSNIFSPTLREIKAGQTPEPKMTYLNDLYNRKSELCDITIGYSYETGKIMYIFLKKA